MLQRGTALTGKNKVAGCMAVHSKSASRMLLSLLLCGKVRTRHVTRVTSRVGPYSMEDDSEMSQIFPGEHNVDLYDVLALKSDASQQDIKKAYRKLALVCHPDKHTNSPEHERAHALKRFQQIGFAYAVLSDETRRKRYDRTGTTGEGILDPGADGGWEAYFQDLFDRVTRGKLDEMKNEYQGGY